MNSQKGFTLIELLVVVLVVAIIASIAVPNLVAARVNTNETAALATLRTVFSAQAQFKIQASADLNGNGMGEHGYFAELAGSIPPRGAVTPLNPSVLSGALGIVNGSIVQKSGYLFAMYLPGANGAPVLEAAAGGTPGGLDDQLAETLWACYAWPSSAQSTGTRSLMINQAGDILQTRGLVTSYSGTAAMPAGDAAFTVADDLGAPLAIGIPGNDGNTWRSVN